MKKGIYEQPRITIYEVETTAILAGSGRTQSTEQTAELQLRER